MEVTLHQILYSLSNAVSNILLSIDAGDHDYDTKAEITLTKVEEELTEHPEEVLVLKVQTRSSIIHEVSIT